MKNINKDIDNVLCNLAFKYLSFSVETVCVKNCLFLKFILLLYTNKNTCFK